MKRPLPLTMTLLLSTLISIEVSSQLQGVTYASAQQSKTAKFHYVFDGVPGFVAKGANGSAEGFLVDICRKSISEHFGNKRLD